MQRVHFIGVGGAGMSALARVLLEMGDVVSGSDLQASEATARLARQGARIYRGHRPEHVGDAEVVVVSAAVPEDNVELQEARARGLPVLGRGQLLARLMSQRQGVAVAGAHGKTTTASMVASCLEEAGLDPTVLIGGELNDTGTTSHLGRGRYLVAEVDEFDGTISLLEPYLALVTNVDNDHLDRYGGRMDNLMAAFRRFMEKVRPGGTVVACLDSPYLVRALAGFRGPLITYSLHDQAGPDGGADYTARAIEFSPSGTRFRVHHGKVSVGEVFLRVPGVHNVQNALGAIAASLYLGVPFGVAAQALAAFRGVQRRLQILGEAGGVRVVDDYAHHPTELKATLQAARIWAGAGRLVCLFQPHRYTRTQLLHREFGPALALADLVGVTDIYPAAEPVIPGVTGELVAQAARDQGKEVPFLKDGDQTLAWLREQVRPGDLVLVVGAGDVWQLGIRLLEELRGDPSATSAMAATSGTHP